MGFAKQQIEQRGSRQHQRHWVGKHPQPLHQVRGALALNQQIGAELGEPRLGLFAAKTAKSAGDAIFGC